MKLIKSNKTKPVIIQGDFSGITNTLYEMKSLIHKLNGEGDIEDIENIPANLKNIFIDYSLMERIQWERVAVFDYEETDKEIYVIYKDQYLKELGRESVGNIIRKKIEINTVFGGKK
jgi:hypothetical protein